MKQKKGFTIIELMIVVAIIGIIAAIAYPSYTEHVCRSKRSEAMAAVMNVSQAMERWRVAYNHYQLEPDPNDITIIYSDHVPLSGGDPYYRLSIETTIRGYDITASPIGAMAAIDGPLTLDERGNRTSTSGNRWPLTGDPCGN